MKAKIQLYQNDGESLHGYPVKLILSHERKTRRKTLSYSNLNDWDLLKNLPLKTHPDFEELYSRILNMKAKSIKFDFRELTDFEDAFELLLDKRKKKVDLFSEWADQRISFMEKNNRPGNADAYRTAKNQLDKFAPYLKLSEITPRLLDNFKVFKKSEGLKNTSIKNYLVEIRAIYNAAVKAGIVEDSKPFTGVLNNLAIQKRRQRNRYLAPEEIKRLENLNLEQDSFQRALDFSLLQFYLCGVDLIDIYYLKKEDLLNDRVILTRRKLGDKAYEFDVYLPSKAKKIINKYKVLEGENVFPWKKEYISYKTFRNNHNRSLKKIQDQLEIKLLPKNDSFTTKVMRHTFATLGKFERIEEDLLRELMGHERNDIDTVYKDKYPQSERDAAQLKIIGEKIPSKIKQKNKSKD